MIESKYNNGFDDQPFWITFDVDKKVPQLLDTGVLVAVFKDGKWQEVDEPRVLGRGETKDITKEEFDAITGGILPDVNPDELMPL